MLNAAGAIYNPRFLDLKHKLTGRMRIDKVDPASQDPFLAVGVASGCVRLTFGFRPE
jgi:hypothetical protein